MDAVQVSFVKGEITPLAASRTDEQMYQSAVARMVNFFTRREGAASNRAGFEYIANCNTNIPNGSYLLPFIYNNEQSYIAEVAAGNIAIYEEGALVQTGIANPYHLPDLPNLRWAQSADVLTAVVATQPMQQLTRTTPTNFTFTAPQLLFGPFQDTNTDATTTVYASAIQGSITLTASKSIFLPTHVGALFYLQEQFLSWIQPWESDKIMSTTADDVIGSYIRSDGKIYKCVATGGTGTVATGTFQPVHTSGTLWDGNGQQVPGSSDNYGVAWQFVSTDAGVALITGYTDAKHVTAVVQSDKGVWSNFPPSVVGGPSTLNGPYLSNGDGTTAIFTNLSSITSNDPNNYYVTVGGIFQDPSTYFIDVSATSITFYTPPALGTNNISVAQIAPVPTTGEPLESTGLNLSTYWAFGSISAVQGYAATVCYFNDRLVLGGTTAQPQTFFMSQVSDYLNYGVSSPQVDSDAITETMNARQQNPIVDLMPLNDLLVGTATATWRITHSASVGAVTPSDIALLPQEFYGVQGVPVAQTGSTIIYVEWGGRKVRDVVYQFLYDKFIGQELTVLAQQNIIPFGTTITRMAFSPEPYGLLFCVRSDGVLCVCSYMLEQQGTATSGYLIAWSRWITKGNFEDVQVVPENGSFSVYVIVGRTINGAYQRYIERLEAREVSSNDDYFFVDSGLTYDGRNTSSTTMQVDGGTTWLAGDTGTVTANTIDGWSGFASTDLGNEIWVYDSVGNKARVLIVTVINNVFAAVAFLDPIPIDLQSKTTAEWTFAKANLSGLTNLPGQTVAVYADSAVLPPVVVSLAGTVQLQSPAGVAHIGLPYTYQLQSLNFNIQGAPSIRNRAKSVPAVSFIVDSSMPFFAGQSFDPAQMVPVAMRQFENWGQPIPPQTGTIRVQIPAFNDDNACVCVAGSDPVPVTITGWLADVSIGEK